VEATGITTRMVEGVAPLIDRIGYRTVELASSTLLATTVRYHREDPWARLRAARDRMPHTQLGFLTTGKRFITFYRTPDAVFELAFSLLVRNGIRRLWVIDPMYDMDGAKRTAEMAKRVGFEEVVAASAIPPARSTPTSTLPTRSPNWMPAKPSTASTSRIRPACSPRSA